MGKFRLKRGDFGAEMWEFWGKKEILGSTWAKFGGKPGNFS